MEKGIKISAGNVVARAVLNDSPTAQKIWEALPIEARGDTWGDEIYFGIPVKAPLEKNAQEVVQVGDLGFWPPGHAFCLFFGPTPVSRGSEVRPASAVNVVGRIEGDAKIFKKVPSETKIKIEKE
ncbi:MAG: hypothetical protein H6Q43_3881 [Deltaproteobacteria bacterium]|nr:hypothetical protein [Deltaproteobacteria bacterium]